MEVEENLNNFLKGLNIEPKDLTRPEQVHGAEIFLLDKKYNKRNHSRYPIKIPGCDALITKIRKLPLAIFTADCLSIFLYEPETSIIGLIHAGWRGSKDKITLRTINLMKERFKIKPENLMVALGPVIRDCCYEVAGELKDYFLKDYIQERKAKFYLNLVQINKRELIESGVKEENIIDPGVCTSCNNDELFSYRKEGQNAGRQISLAMLL